MNDEQQNYPAPLWALAARSGPRSKAAALALYLDIAVDEVEPSSYCDETFEAYGAEYRVLTESEADDAWDDALDCYLDEMLDGLPSGPLAQYFDREAWKRDARHDGRGHALSSYDGQEHNIGDGFVAFRTN